MCFRLLLFTICLILVSCGQQPSSNSWINSDGKIRVLSTTAMIDDIVGKVGKERIHHFALIRGEIDPHSYELVKGDDEKFVLANIVFYNGLGLEHGASLRYQLQHHANAVSLGDKIRERQPEAILSRNGQIDPHVWMDIALWTEIIDPIVVELSKADPEGASYFEANGEAMKEEMLLAHNKLKSRLAEIPPTRRYLVTSHDAFNYFTRCYLKADEENWKTRFRAPEGLAPDGQLSCSDIQGIIDHLCLYRIGVVFPESNVSKDSLKKIVSACREKGLDVKIAKEILYADALGNSESEANTYLEMMEHNAKVLFNEWK